MPEPAAPTTLRGRLVEALREVACSWRFKDGVYDEDLEDAAAAVLYAMRSQESTGLRERVAAARSLADTLDARGTRSADSDLCAAAGLLRLLAQNAADRDRLAAEVAELRVSRGRYRSAWQSARERAQSLSEGIERLCRDRDSWKGWLRTAEAEVRRLTDLVGQYADRGIANGERAEAAEKRIQTVTEATILWRDRPGGDVGLAIALAGILDAEQPEPPAATALVSVLKECDRIEREVYGQRDEDDDGMREAVRRIRAAAGVAVPEPQPDPRCPTALDGTGEAS